MRSHPAGLWRLLAVAVLTALALSVAPAQPAAAHAFLLFTSPAADGGVPASPAELTLTFDSHVTLPSGAVRLTAPDGHAVALGRPAQNATTVTVPVSATLRPGNYTVNWQVTASDGDSVEGSYRFAIGPSVAGSSLQAAGYTSPPAAPGQWPTAALRWVLFAALAVALGGFAGAWLAWRRSGKAPRAAPAPWVWQASTAGAAAAAGLALLIAGNGAFLEGLWHPGRVLGSRPGIVAVLELAAFALVGAAARLGLKARWPFSALLIVAAAEAVRGHPQAATPLWGAALIFVHLTAVALWIGALLHVVRTGWAWRQAPKLTWHLIRDYARLAAWLLGAVVVTGTVAALLVVPLPALLTTTYGRTLLVKLAVVAGATGLALTARLRLRRGPGGHAERPARLEAAALTGVLAVTALLTSVPPPADAGRALAFPPPPSGPILPLGALAGQVSVFAQASQGQLVVRLRVPGSDDQPPSAQAGAPARVVDSPARTPRYALSAVLADPAGTTQRLTMRRCGAGCFVAPARWRDGTSQLTLHATAPGWPGGTVALPLSWPPRPDTAALPRLLTAMRTVKQFTLYERVTSDTTRQGGPLHHINMSGERFLGSEPYGSGAPIVTRLDPVTVIVAIPTERFQARLTLDSKGRLTHEVFTAPGYLTTRTFLYPDENT